MSSKFGLVVRFTLKPDHGDAFDELVSETLPGIREEEPGTLIYTCQTVQDAPNERIFYEVYADRAAFDAHEEQPHVKRFLADREQHLDRVDVDFVTVTDGKGLPAGG